MSAFIKLNKQDAFVVPYTAHKSFSYTSVADSGSTGVQIHHGTKDRTTLFTPAEYTFHSEYPRLVYDSINHLYYSNFSSSLESGSFDNYNQSTLFFSRSLSGIEEIFVVSVQRNRFGEAIKPTSFRFQTGSIVLVDDGEGNITPASNLTLSNTALTYSSQSVTVATIPDSTTITFTAGITIPSGYTFVSASWTGTPARSPFTTFIADDIVQTVPNTGLTLDDINGTLTTTGDPTYFVDRGGSGQAISLVFVSSSVATTTIPQGFRVGNIFYSHGIAAITGTTDLVQLLDNLNETQTRLDWQATHTVYQSEYKCKIRESDLNYSQNPSIKSGSNGDVYDFATGSYFQPYVTTVGLYNDANELVAVGKLAQPVPKSRYTDMTFIVKFDT